MYNQLPDGQLVEDTPVLVKYSLTPEEERGDRAAWPWLPGTILQQVGADEFQIVVEDLAVAVRADGSKPTPRTPKNRLYFPLCFRDASEIKLIFRPARQAGRRHRRALQRRWPGRRLHHPLNAAHADELVGSALRSNLSHPASLNTRTKSDDHQRIFRLRRRRHALVLP